MSLPLEFNELSEEMNLHAASAYALHLLTARSTAGHGVHSPWMFRFITEVIGGRGDSAIMREVESLRQEMLSDRRMVMVTDLGAGSSVMKSRERSVRHIASAAAVPKREAALLARIAESLNNTRTGEPGDADRHAEQSGTGLKPGKMAATDPVPAVVPDSGHSCREDAGRDNLPVILELGTSLGISTLALALGAPQRRVISVEGCPELAAVARENLRRHGALNAEIICMEFGQALTDLHKKGVKVALAFIDGNHRGAAMTEYMHKIRQMGEEMIIIAHDIRMNRDMIKAWHSIVSGSAVYRQAAGRLKSHGDGQLLADISPGPALSGQAQTPSPAPSEQEQASAPTPPGPIQATLETLRMGMLFCIPSITPGHYRVRY